MTPNTTWQALDLAITLLEQFEAQLSAQDKDMLDHLREYRDFDKPMLAPSQEILDFVANDATPRLKALFGDDIKLSQEWDSEWKELIIEIWNKPDVEVENAMALLDQFNNWYFETDDESFRHTLFTLRWEQS